MARRQHQTYVSQLASAGYTLHHLAADENLPDCVFVEDTAVIVGEVAVITRPGAPSRREEITAVTEALTPFYPTRFIEGEATLDGGDVFRAGDILYVGRSQRTNEAGIEQLTAFAAEQGLEVIAVPVTGVLHLKSAVLPVGPETVVVTPGCVDEDRLPGLRLIYEDPDERHRFSALPLRNGSLLVTGNALRTASLLATAGFDPLPIDISQIQLADGGLTCLSILFPA
jgi:dimethylargininase